MFIPYSVDVPMERIPLANWVLIGLTAILSIMVWTGAFEEKGNFDLDELLHKKLDAKDLENIQKQIHGISPRWKPPPLSLQPTNFSLGQLISHLFVHGNILHLIGNLIFLFVFGNAVNAKLGHVAFLLSYFLLGGIAGLAWVMLGNGLPMIGASGAIMGIVGIFFVLYPRNEVSVLFYLRGAGSFEISAVWLILIYMAFDLVGTLNQVGGVAYISHLAGEILGIALAILLVATGFLKSQPYEENLLECMGYLPKPKHSKKKPKSEENDDDE